MTLAYMLRMLVSSAWGSAVPTASGKTGWGWRRKASGFSIRTEHSLLTLSVFLQTGIGLPLCCSLAGTEHREEPALDSCDKDSDKGGMEVGAQRRDPPWSSQELLQEAVAEPSLEGREFLRPKGKTFLAETTVLRVGAGPEPEAPICWLCPHSRGPFAPH